MKHFAFIRHGDYHQLDNVPSAYQPFPLNEAGLEQAQAAVVKVQQYCQSQQIQLSQMHSSVLLRAWQTADIIAKGLAFSSPIIQTEQLTERCVGSVANLTTHQIEQVLEADPRYLAAPAGWKSDSHYQLPFPGAESLMQAGSRVADYVKQANQASSEGLVLFIGHGAAIRHAAHQLGLLSFDQIAKLSMYHAEPVFFRLEANQNWQHSGGQWKVRQTKSQYTD